VSGDYKLVSGE